MQNKKSLLHKTGLVVGLATFLISNASANPFQAETLKTGYGNTETGGTSGNNSAGPVTPHSFQDDLTGEAPHSEGPVVASDSDTLGDYTPEPESHSPTQGECDASGAEQ